MARSCSELADGDAVAEAAVPPARFDAPAGRWRAMVHAQALAAHAITLLLLIGPLLDRRAAARETRERSYLTRSRPRAARRRCPRDSGRPSASSAARRRPCRGT